MEAFDLREQLISDYQEYVRSFIRIRDKRIEAQVTSSIDDGALWPEPLIQLNPAFEDGGTIPDLVKSGTLHPECEKIFMLDKDVEGKSRRPMSLRKHQQEAIFAAQTGGSYVLTTGTGSGKSIAYIVPIVDHILRRGSGKGVQAIVVYPMNALANSQYDELSKFIRAGYPPDRAPIKFDRYTGQDQEESKRRIIDDPPDILLTNFVMLELILTRTEEKSLVEAAKGIKFLVLDELHTYRGRQGADVAMLARRLRNRLNPTGLQCVGTSATLSTEGTFRKQQEDVAAVATKIFGTLVKPENIIGETLRRSTKEIESNDLEFKAQLREKVSAEPYQPPRTEAEIQVDPLARWIENFYGIERKDGRLVRRLPSSIGGPTGAANALAADLSIPTAKCEAAIRATLLSGNQIKTSSGFPFFAFRLHQFISRGGTVYASLESEADRYISLSGQQYVPGSRDKILLPLCFCRECGQEYYSIYIKKDAEAPQPLISARELGDRAKDVDLGDPGFLYLSSANPWQEDNVDDVFERIPQDWIEGDEIPKSKRDLLPVHMSIDPSGTSGASAAPLHFIKAPFRFCLNCGVAYDAYQRSDFSKLSTLSSEGRSTATTILSLSAIRYVKSSSTLELSAQKMLSFTDNRQDASLQSGHFNDFVQVSLLRSALYDAICKGPTDGLSHDVLTQKIFESLDLPFGHYAADPDVKFQQRKNTEQALRDVIGYRIYRDLERGWRITAPNLEQSGLLNIHYASLADLCAAEEEWFNTHAALLQAAPEVRQRVCKTLLDYLRRELCIKVDFLRYEDLGQIRQRSNTNLRSPWAIDENEKPQYARIIFPRSRKPGDDGSFSYLSARSGFGNYLRRPETLGTHNQRLNLKECGEIILSLFKVLKVAGLVEEIIQAKTTQDVPGYQIPASAMYWAKGDGQQAFHDPIRVPRISKEGVGTNKFFVDLYRRFDRALIDMEAREHTAQVKNEVREERENRFRRGTLPILFCSPTMELGVDIASLNIVNMRNIPPTPANYAQRSGRAGRSGQPALVFSYCTTGSAHDQYFYRRPKLMVSGAVRPPRIDLSNEDLIRSHVYAIWLEESKLSLQKSLSQLLDLSGEQPSLSLLQSVKDDLNNTSALGRAKTRAAAVIESMYDSLKECHWFTSDWLDRTLGRIELEFEHSCLRWRTLYRAALDQRDFQAKIVNDRSRQQNERDRAKRLRDEADAQLDILVDVKNVFQSDFYSYRYFASEGFLPGYNFPRLPLSAFIPGRRLRSTDDNYLSRPRFLAISEFGPQAIIYHEGSRYQINRVMLKHDDGELATQTAKLCDNCGYVHPIHEGAGPDICERCASPLKRLRNNLFRLENVSTRRVDRISSDEEERLRLGYRLRTAIRFADRDGISYQVATVLNGDSVIADFCYGDAASIWRVNLGWLRSAEDKPEGFQLDTERGYWEKNSNNDNDEPTDDGEEPRKPIRVIPFVEGTKNSLLFQPRIKLNPSQMASLQAALKIAIQTRYQLEDSELAAESLPTRDERNVILFYESGEGGAGVLKQLMVSRNELNEVAKTALDLLHFDPVSGEDKKRAERASEDCEAACYDCLLNYGNQLDHPLLDRKSIKDYLVELRDSRIDTSPAPVSREEHFNKLLRYCESSLEKDWIKMLYEGGYNLPRKAQVYLEQYNVRPDFLYDDLDVAIFVDGPHHKYPERAKRDEKQRTALDEAGFTVISFSDEDDWEDIITMYPTVFGVGKEGRS